MYKNSCIKCSVQQCQHYAEGNYCSLQSIMVGTHEADPKMPQCTDCMSFQKKGCC